MSIIRARADDWRPNNPNIRPGAWIAAFIAVAVFSIAVAGLVGHVMIGNGAPFLS